MSFCLNCGSQLMAGARFCGNCGAAVANSAPPTTPYTAPTPPPARTPVATDPRPTPDFFSGDWRGALAATLAALGTMAGLGLAGLIVADTEGSYDGSGIVGDVFKLVALAAGGELRSEFSRGFGGSAASVAFRPLTLTLVGYSVLAVSVLRRLRRAGPVTAAAAGMQAGRVAIVHAAGLLVVALLSTIGDRSSEVGAGSRINITSTLVSGTVTLAVALAIAALVGLSGLFGGRIEYYRGVLAGPVRSMLFLVVASCVASLIAIALITFLDSDFETSDLDEVLRALGGLTLLVLPNIAGFALLFGMGVPLHAGGFVSVFGTDNSGGGSLNIVDVIDQDDRFWLWPLVAVVLLVFTGVYSARRSPPAANGRPVGWWLAVVLPVTLWLLSLSIDVSANLGGGIGPVSGGGSVGFDLLFVLLLGAAYGLGAGMLGAVLVPRRPTMAPTPG